MHIGNMGKSWNFFMGNVLCFKMDYRICFRLRR